MTSHLPDDAPNTPAYWFMKWALETSTTYDSIKWRLGTALLAQEKVTQSISQPLSDSHWEVEARRLFVTSLARIQFDAWSIARGEDREQPGYKDSTPDEGRGKLCGLYKFNSIGYTNINLGAFIGLLLTPFFILLGSLEARKVKKFLQHVCRRKETSNTERIRETSWEPLLINIFLKYLVYLILLIPYGLLLCGSWLYKKVH
jgi:hypothetical protein